MAADKLRIVVDETLVTIKQTFDDKDVTRAQAAFWIIAVANKMLGQHNFKRDSGAFMTPFYGIPVQENNGRKYVELPGNIFNYDKDDGVEYIAFYNPNDEDDDQLGKRKVFRVSPSELEWLELSVNTKAGTKTPYWYRAENKFYLRGIEHVPVKEVEMGLYLTIDPLEKIDIDAPFPFPQELMEDLKRRVVDLARYSFLFPDDRSNEGDDSASGQGNKNIPKILSVNDQQQAQ